MDQAEEQYRKAVAEAEAVAGAAAEDDAARTAPSMP